VAVRADTNEPHSIAPYRTAGAAGS
jgi:hypothetical protein